jgi:branched-chain amino acid transport system permease protein
MTDVLQYAINAISLGSQYALYACGLALMLSVARIANFAYGDFMMVGAYALLLAVGSLPWPLVILFVIVVAAALNVLIDRLVFSSVRGRDGMTLLVISFGVSTLIQNVMIAIAGARSKSVDFGGSFGKAFNIGDVSVTRLDILTIATTAFVLVALTVFLRRSLLGMQLRAASEDFMMSRLLGVKANRVIAAAFAIAGAIGGVAAVLMTMKSGSLSIDMGLQPTLLAFIAVVVGGMGSVAGATLAGLLLGVLTVVLQATLPSDLQPYREAILFSLIIIMLLGRPQGIFGARVAGARV